MYIAYLVYIIVIIITIFIIIAIVRIIESPRLEKTCRITQSNHKLCSQQHCAVLEAECLESYVKEKDLWVLVSAQLKMRHQCAQVAKTTTT